MSDTWTNFIVKEMEKPYFNNISQVIGKDILTGHKLCPRQDNIFRIFNALSYENVKIVILAQDPYYARLDQANGFAFAVNCNIPIPDSLKGIFKEIKADIGILPEDRTLEYLVKQGVFLLNTALTTRLKTAFAHGKVWQPFTDNVISFLNQRKESIIFLLWGSKAVSKKTLITGKQHYVLDTSHPSPLGAYRGFLGCKHFSKANKILLDMNKKEIDWVGKINELEF